MLDALTVDGLIDHAVYGVGNQHVKKRVCTNQEDVLCNEAG